MALEPRRRRLASEEARKLTQSSRGELQRVRARIADLDKKIGSMTRLLVDPDIDATAKRAVSRQVGELEAERERLQQAVAKVARKQSVYFGLLGARERLQQAVAELAGDAHDHTGRLAAAVHQAFAEAQESLATLATPTVATPVVPILPVATPVARIPTVATPTEMRDFLERYVGPMVLKPSGDIARKETAPAEAGAVKRSIAGARWVPWRIREMFWERFASAA